MSSSSLERDIRALQSGLDILTIGTAWASSLRLSAQKQILIVEGMSAAFLPKNLFDLSICFHTDEGTELERRLARDTAVRGRDVHWIRQAHTSRQQYEHYYKMYQEEADFLISQTEEGFGIDKISNGLGK